MQGFHGRLNFSLVDGIAEPDMVMLVDNRHNIAKGARKGCSQLTVTGKSTTNKGYRGEVGKAFDLIGIKSGGVFPTEGNS